MSTLYSGPGKVIRAADSTIVGSVTGTALATTFMPEGENGPVRVSVTEDSAEIASSFHGRITEQWRDQIVEVVFRPFDNWGLLHQLFPPWIGADTSAVLIGGDTHAGHGQVASIQVGARPHGVGGAHVATKVWAADNQRLYNITRSAVVGHPTIHLGIGKALFGDARITGVGDETKTPFVVDYLMAITESGVTDPTPTVFTMDDFVRGAWKGTWGDGATGVSAGFLNVEAEDEWTIDTAVKYSPLKVQGRTLAYKIDSAMFAVKVRPYGPTHSQIAAALGSHQQGQWVGHSATSPASRDLVLTGPNAHTITLHNCDVKGAGFEFGGTTLGTGEIAFVSGMTFTSGQPNGLITFGA